jgi:hypothetical protein
MDRSTATTDNNACTTFLAHRIGFGIIIAYVIIFLFLGELCSFLSRHRSHILSSCFLVKQKEIFKLRILGIEYNIEIHTCNLAILLSLLLFTYIYIEETKQRCLEFSPPSSVSRTKLPLD